MPSHSVPIRPSRPEPSRPESLSDDALLARLAEILGDSRRTEADLVAHIAEVDGRRLYLREACTSMFAYCVERLHLSEPETALRIVVARATRQHPTLLDMLRDGRLHLSGIALLAPHLGSLDEETRESVLARACHLSKRQIEQLLASLAPRPDVPSLVRKLPDPRGERSEMLRAPAVGLEAKTQHRPDDVAAADLVSQPLPGSTPARHQPGLPSDHAATTTIRRQPSPAAITPLSPARYHVQFTASAQLKAKIDRLQQLMRRSVPNGDIATLIETAVTTQIARLEARRLGATSRPRKSPAQSDTRPGPRYIPAAVRRAVRERDGDRCAYVDRRGRRCGSADNLEFHHRVPHAWNGDRSAANLTLRCRSHNAHEARTDFGAAAIPRGPRQAWSAPAPGSSPAPGRRRPPTAAGSG